MTVLRHRMVAVNGQPLAGLVASVMEYNDFDVALQTYRRVPIIYATSDDSGWLSWTLPPARTNQYLITGIESNQVLVTVPVGVSTATVTEIRTGTVTPSRPFVGVDLVTELELATRLAGMTAGMVSMPTTDAAKEAFIPGRLSDAGLRAVFVPFWEPDKPIGAGAVRMTALGLTITRNSSGTTRSTYDATEAALWTVSSGASGGGGTATTDASQLTSGILPAARIGDASIADAKLASGTALTAAERTKLTGIAAGATVNATDAQLRDRSTHTGTQAVTTISGLAAVATSGAKADVGLGSVDNTSDLAKPVSTAQAAADTAAKDRVNHTGTQLSGTIADLAEAVQDIVAGFIAPGSGLTKSYDDAGNILTLTATASGGTTDPEIVRDTIGGALVQGAGITIVVNDAGDTITIASTAVLPTRQIITGTGLSGGGDLSADRTLAVTYGTAAGTAAQGNDSRLSDARTPLAHTHPATGISDSTTVGRSVMTAVDGPAARTAIGAGTSNLALGTTSATAKVGDYQPTAANISDATVTGRSVLTAIDGPAARTAIGAGTSNLALGTTGTTAKAGDYAPTAANISDATAIGRSLLTAADAATARAVTGAGTSNLALGTTSTTAKAGDYAPTFADLPAGSMISMIQNSDGSWPNRRSSRTDLQGVWTRIVAGSADPAAATSPAVTGAYSKDFVVGP